MEKIKLAVDLLYKKYRHHEGEATIQNEHSFQHGREYGKSLAYADAVHILNPIVESQEKIFNELVKELEDILKWTKIKNGVATWSSSEKKATELKKIINTTEK